jgi:hypothetical protein
MAAPVAVLPIGDAMAFLMVRFGIYLNKLEKKME